MTAQEKLILMVREEIHWLQQNGRWERSWKLQDKLNDINGQIGDEKVRLQLQEK